MRTMCGTALSLLILVLSVSAAPAPEARPLGSLEAGVLLILRLIDSRVREALKLSESQVKKIEELNAELRQAFPSTRGLSREAMQKRQQDRRNRNKRHQEAIVKILSKKQLRRAEQIYLQRIGPMSAFRNPPVAAALKLTAEQKEKVELIEKDVSSFLRAPGTARRGGKRREEAQAFIQKRREWRKVQDEKVLNVLTPPQKARWEQLIGVPFKLEPSPAKEKDQPRQSADRSALAR